MSTPTKKKIKRRPAPVKGSVKKKKVSEVAIEDVTDDEKMGAIADESASAAIEKLKGSNSQPAPAINMTQNVKPLPKDVHPWWLAQLKPGVYEVFLIESVVNQDEKPSKWQWEIDEVANSLNKARTLRNKTEKTLVEVVATRREHQWRHDHMHDQKSVEHAQFKITAKTTDDEMLKWVERAQEIRQGLTDVPPVKMPKSFKPKKDDRDFPQVRIRRAFVGVEFEDVPNS